MKKETHQRAMAYKKQPPKFTEEEKAEILSNIKTEIAQTKKLLKKVSRIDMQSNQIYLYKLVEQYKSEKITYIVPLIEGKYREFPYARITLHDALGVYCTVDCQRDNKWVSCISAPLTKLIHSIENCDTWFKEENVED